VCVREREREREGREGGRERGRKEGSEEGFAPIQLHRSAEARTRVLEPTPDVNH
jgi:predicted transposase YdaD